MQGLQDKKLKGQLAIREELYGKSAKAAAKIEKVTILLPFEQMALFFFLFFSFEVNCPLAFLLFLNLGFLFFSGFYQVKVAIWRQKV